MGGNVGRNPWQETEEKAPWWKKTVTKVMAAAGAVVLAALTGWLSPPVQQWLQSMTDAPEPVRTTARELEAWHPLVLPDGEELSSQQLKILNALPPEGQRDRLKDLGAATNGETIYLTLTGQHTEPVRVTEIRPTTRCKDPYTQSVILLDDTMAAVEVAEYAYLQVDEPHPTLRAVDESGNERDYFPHKTIRLAKDETVNLEIVTFSESHYCEFTLEMTVVEKDETTVVRIDNNGQPFVRTPVFDAFDRVYIGGYICKQIAVSAGSVQKHRDACGPGNQGDSAAPLG